MHELVRALSDIDGVRISVSFNAAMSDAALIARSVLSDFVAPDDTHVWHGKVEGGEVGTGFTEWRRLSEIALVHHVNTLKPDLALSASPFEGTFDVAVPFVGGPQCIVPTAAIFYDAIPWRFAEHYLPNRASREYYRRRLAMLPGFDRVYAISDFAAREAASVAGVSDAVDIGAGVSRHMLEIVARMRGLPRGTERYFLYVGGLDWRKNLAVLIDAFAEFAQSDTSGTTLRIVGDHSPSIVHDIRQHARNRGLDDTKVRFLSHVSDEELVSHYRGALALIQPSFMEGFGLTALEALTCGTPAIVANAGAVPEIVGDSDLVFDPSSPGMLAGLMREVSSPAFDRAKAVRHERKAADRFTWSRAAERFVDAAPRASTVRKDDPRSLALAQIGASHSTAPSEHVAEMMALSELQTDGGRRRLFVEGSSTMLVDHKTGIQRVVNRICQHILDADPEVDTRILFCDDHSGWYASRRWEARPIVKTKANLVSARRGDTFLMLDSSWAFHTIHQRLFSEARLKGAQIVSCLYDTVPLRTPGFCDAGMPIIFAEWFRTALTHSSGFVCISRAVADELHAILEAIAFPRAVKIGYWQLGADFTALDSAPARPQAAKQRPVFLMVGTLEPRKGHRVALDAFEKLWARGFDAELVIVGKPGWGTGALAQRLRDHMEYGRRLSWHERVDDATLAALYEGCDCLLAASFAEGFGLPIVEAGHFGKPVIASDIAVFREVAAGARGAHFFDVGSPDSLAEVLERFIGDIETRAVEPVAEATAWPSWRTSARQLQDIITKDDWYRTYQPRDRPTFVSSEVMARPRMDAALPPDERQGTIELVEGPTVSDDGATLKITVRAVNRTKRSWSSEGPTDGALGVRIAYRVLDASGAIIDGDGGRTIFPLVLAPNDPNYFAVTVPTVARENGGAFVEIRFVQESVAWFDNPLRVAI
ncbi:glycosyltransferase family 4 protein [Aureimonas mangrovi]|uniref:glycosyltransferase family 4 protein n=1 Tax=Aureimonas mangrovi TaxID=2758041 RepID=UPI00163D5D1D|nr:glycosyltransferase family 1 protein [Aureimonas mangrovi]